MRHILALCMLSLLLVGCGPRYCDYYPYHEDGRSKPAMTILPIQDKSDSGLSWNVAMEVDQYLRYKMLDEGNLYLLPESSCGEAITDHNINYFGSDLTFAKHCRQSEFVTVMELIEHKIVPYESGKITPIYPIHNRQCESVLMMKMRVRIIDVRGDTPRIVLQEIVQSNHMLPRDQNNLDYTSYCFGKEPYNRTPIALSHQRLAYDLARRIETVACGVR